MAQAKRTTRRKIIEPRLKGLFVQSWDKNKDEPQRMLYPWASVSQQPHRGVSSYAILDDQGCALREGRKRVTFGISSRYIRELIRRAQIRAFRMSWTDGTLHLADTYTRSWEYVIPALCSLILLCMGLPTLGLPIIREYLHPQPWTPQDPFYQIGIWVVFALVVLMLSMMAVYGLLQAWRLIWRCQPAESHINSKSLSVRYRDGRGVSVLWRDIREIRWEGHLWARIPTEDGSEIWLGELKPRTRAALQAIEEALFPEAKATAKRSLRRSLSRVIVLLLLGAVLGTVVASLLPYDTRVTRYPWMAGVILGQAPLVILIANLLEKVSKRREKRRYRAKARQRALANQG